MVDAQGSVRASSRATVLGSNRAEQAYFKHLSQGHAAHALHLSQPFTNEIGQTSLGLMRSLHGADGRFIGLVEVILDEAYFQAAFATAL